MGNFFGLAEFFRNLVASRSYPAMWSVTCDANSTTVDQQKLTGFEVRALFAVPNAWSLVLEGPQDRVIADDEEVTLPAALYSRPPSSWGNGGVTGRTPDWLDAALSLAEAFEHATHRAALGTGSIDERRAAWTALARHLALGVALPLEEQP